MEQSFFFYDLETSGLNARNQRIMQFAGQRTDMELHPIGEPVNVLVRLTDDILPEPYAITVTGITPQQTLSDGLSEPELCKLLSDEVFTPGTISVGYNNVRFDDEFMRHTFWRNFYDPYEWTWKDGRSRWDMLDVVRMTRALRPDGIEWPTNADGKPVNKLELIASANKLMHTKAHDALSDVEALIGVASLIKTMQAKLFDYLLGMRDKKKVAELVSLEHPTPFLYSSGRYSPDHLCTTVAFPVGLSPKPGAVLVYDLAVDPTQFINASPKALASILQADRQTREKDGFVPLPVKELSFNKCPAVAPLGVLDDASKKRIGIDLAVVEKHMKVLLANPGFGAAVREAFEMREPYAPSTDVESQLYDGFSGDQDKPRIATVRNADAQELADFHPQFSDDRLTELLLRYKARSFPGSLADDERETWEAYRTAKLQANMPGYFETLAKIAPTADQLLVEELQLWAQSIMPSEV